MTSKKTSKSPIPLPLRNALTGSTRPFWVLSEARASLNLKQLDALAKYMLVLASMGRPAFPSLQAKQLADIRIDDRELKAIPLSAELCWTAAVIDACADRIFSWLRLKTSLEERVLNGDFEAALACLDRINEQGGYSLLTLELRQSILQLSGGLTSQKDYLKTIREIRSSVDAVAYIAFHGSLRNETTTQIFSFRDHFSAKLEGEMAPSAFRTWLLYHICDRTPNNASEASDILRMEQASSVFDLYETYIRCAASLSAHNPQSFEKFIPSLEKLHSRIHDQRLVRLLTLSSSQVAVSAITSLPDDCLLRPELDTRSASDDVGFGRRDPSEALDDAEPVNGPLKDQLQHDLDCLTGREFNIRSFFRLMRVAANFRTTSIPSSFYVDAMDQVNQAPQRDNVALTFGYVYGKDVQPSHLRLLNPSAREQLGARLDKLNPRSIAVRLIFQELGLAVADGGADDIDRDLVDNARLARLADQEQWAEIEHVARRLLDSPRTAVRRNAARFLSNSLLNQQKINEAVEYIVSAILRDDLLSYRLPISGALSHVDRAYRKTYAHRLSTPILYQLLRTRDSKTESFRTYAYEDFLTTHGVSKPSDLRNQWRGFDQDQAVSYLRSVCTPETMQMSSAFSGTKGYEDERIAICSLLAELDPHNAKEYEAESSAITQHQIIRGGVKQVEEKKIYVDVEGIREWAYTDLRESWSRYQALRASGLDASDSALFEAIKEAVKKVAPGTLVLTLPQNEATTLFVSMLDKLRTGFLSHPKHGLDCYLSMRVRHGSLAGHLRSALESNRIITQRDSDDNTYKRNDFWMDRLPYLPEAELARIDEHLREFSRAFDRLIDEYTNSYVQIATTDKADGLMFLNIPETRIAVLAHTLTLDATFEDFVDGAFKLLSEQLDVCLASVRSHIETYLQPKSDEIFSTLEQQLASFGIPQVQELDAAVHAAHTELQQTITQLRQWFHRSEPEKGPDFTFEELVKIGLTCVARIHEQFSPKLIVVSPTEDIVFSDLSFFSDVFFILFDNARIHSGLVNPEVIVRAEVRDEFLYVQVRSQVAAERSLTQIRAKVESIKTMIQRGGYHKAVRSEGGTGLIKLRNILEWEPEGHSILGFAVESSTREFVVDMKIPLLLGRRRTSEVA